MTRAAYRRTASILLCAVTSAALVVGAPAGTASAHERVVLTSANSTPARGPLLKDGTIARAAFATFDGIGQRRGFRVQLAGNADLRMELLIADTPPGNRLPRTALPEVVVIAPDGSRTVMEISERTEFYEPYSRTSYLYLARLRERAQAGIYRVLVTSRSADPVTAVIGVGYREVAGH